MSLTGSIVRVGRVYAGVALAALTLACHEGSDVSGGPLSVIAETDVHVVGTLDAIARIEDLIPASDGAAWVVNSVEPFLILLSGDGQVRACEIRRSKRR